MTEAITLKKGHSFCFESQVYRGGSKKRGVIPGEVVARILELNKKIEADNKKNKTENKTINLEKLRHVDKSEGVRRESVRVNS